MQEERDNEQTKCKWSCLPTFLIAVFALMEDLPVAALAPTKTTSQGGTGLCTSTSLSESESEHAEET
jgi:hypothetical protein